MPASLERLERERRRLAMQVQDEWMRRGMMEEVRMIGEWARRGEMRRTRHFLLDFNDALTTSDLAHWRVLAEEGYPQLPIVGDYSESQDHMTQCCRKQMANGRLITAAIVIRCWHRISSHAHGIGDTRWRRQSRRPMGRW